MYKKSEANKILECVS